MNSIHEVGHIGPVCQKKKNHKKKYIEEYSTYEMFLDGSATLHFDFVLKVQMNLNSQIQT